MTTKNMTMTKTKLPDMAEWRERCSGPEHPMKMLMALEPAVKEAAEHGADASDDHVFGVVMPLTARLGEILSCPVIVRGYDTVTRDMIRERIGRLQQLAGLQ